MAALQLLKETAASNGMLPGKVYEVLFQLAQRTEGQNFIEVGTAHGAATIALALGAIERSHPPKIWTMDPLGGVFSSRSGYGTSDDNRAIVEENFRRAGVAALIELFVGTSVDFAGSDRCPAQVDLLLLDADGRIDRDLGIFYPRMRPGAPIVVDDVDSSVYLGRNSRGNTYVDLKHCITALLLAAYERAGVLHLAEQVENTAFCRRGDREYDPLAFVEIALSCYRQLVFTELSEKSLTERTVSRVIQARDACNKSMAWVKSLA